MRIYLVRHGITAWNKENRVQGREEVPLLPEGEEQARQAANALSRAGIRAIHSSPLGRAVVTAKMLDNKIGCGITLDERLIERDFGAVSGTVVSDLYDAERFSEMIEPLEQVEKRMMDALCDIARSSSGTAAVISHGGAINAALRHVSNGVIGTGITKLKNASISTLEYRDGLFSVLFYDESAEEFSQREDKL